MDALKIAKQFKLCFCITTVNEPTVEVHFDETASNDTQMSLEVMF